MPSNGSTGVDTSLCGRHRPPRSDLGIAQDRATTAVRGNVDRDEGAAGYTQTERVKLGGRWLYVLHNIAELDPIRRRPASTWSSRAIRIAEDETVNGVVTSIREAPGHDA